MAYEYYNPNPVGRFVKDCVPRALSKALNTDWETAKVLISNASFKMGNMENGDDVWAAVLRQNGFYREVVPNTCPDCYTLEDFCKDNPRGTFVVYTSEHPVAVVDGVIYDSWDSSLEIPQYYWYKKEDKNGKH